MDFADKLYHIQDRPHDQMSIELCIYGIRLTLRGKWRTMPEWQISVQKMVKCISYKLGEVAEMGYDGK